MWPVWPSPTLLAMNAGKRPGRLWIISPRVIQPPSLGAPIGSHRLEAGRRSRRGQQRWGRGHLVLFLVAFDFRRAIFFVPALTWSAVFVDWFVLRGWPPSAREELRWYSGAPAWGPRSPSDFRTTSTEVWSLATIVLSCIPARSIETIARRIAGEAYHMHQSGASKTVGLPLKARTVALVVIDRVVTATDIITTTFHRLRPTNAATNQSQKCEMPQ